MAEKNESFLEILNSYFSSLSDEQVVAGTKEKVTIPMEWISSNKLERAVIENAFISLFCRANKGYKSMLKQDKQFYGKIASLEIERTEGGTNLVINSRDGWTRIVVTQNKDLRGPFYAISEERFYKEILTSYDLKSVGQVCQEYNLSMNERDQFIQKLRDPETHKLREDLIISEMNDAARNLTKYYDYISKKKSKYEALSGVVQQRKGKGYRESIQGTSAQPRKSEIYDFEEREQILQEMNPIQIITIDKIDEDNTVSKFAYTTYVYRNPRGKEGYLFIAEPFEGIHHTRMRFVPQREFAGLQVRQGKNQLVYLTEKFMEMSDSEFDSNKFSKKLKHTSIEKYREKLRRIVLGAPIKKHSEEGVYAQIDRILFDGEIKKTKDNIREWVSQVLPTQISGARNEVHARPKPQAQQGEINLLQ